MTVLDSLTDVGKSVTTDDDLVSILIPVEDVALLAALKVLVVVLVGGAIAVVLVLEVLTVCVVVTLLDTEGENDPLSK